MSEDKYTIDDMLDTSAREQPNEFKTAFDSIMADKIASKIGDLKAAMAAGVLADEDEEDLEAAAELEQDDDELGDEVEDEEGLQAAADDELEVEVEDDDVGVTGEEDEEEGT